MREESHLDDMRAAIRGDFERLEERRGEQELMRVDTEEPAEIPQFEPQPQPELALEPEPEPDLAPEPEQEPDLEPDLEPEPAPEPTPTMEETISSEDGEQPEPERSWLDRLLGR